MNDDNRKPAEADSNPYEVSPVGEPANTDSLPQVDTAAGQSAEMQGMASQLMALEQQAISGANWFFWVAVLSLVNSVIMLAGGGIFFVIGLGVTLIGDSIAAGIAEGEPELATIVKVVAFGFDLFVAAVLCGFGWLSRRGVLPVFAIGMVLYLLDGLIFLALGDWMSVAFHVFALFGMWGGISAFRKLKQFKRSLENELAAPLEGTV